MERGRAERSSGARRLTPARLIFSRSIEASAQSLDYMAIGARNLGQASAPRTLIFMSELVTLTADIVSAFVENNSVAVADLPALITSTHNALAGLGQTADAEPAPPEYVAAVTVRKSLSNPDFVISMIDGKPYKMLKRHLSGNGLTPEEYRARYNLPRIIPWSRPPMPRSAASWPSALDSVASQVSPRQSGRLRQSSRARKITHLAGDQRSANCLQSRSMAGNSVFAARWWPIAPSRKAVIGGWRRLSRCERSRSVRESRHHRSPGLRCNRLRYPPRAIALASRTSRRIRERRESEGPYHSRWTRASPNRTSPMSR